MSPFGRATKTRVASSSVKSLLLRLLPLLLLAGSPAWAMLCRASQSVAAQAEFRLTGGKAFPPSGSAHAAKRRGLENEANAPATASRRTSLVLSSQDSRGAAAGSVETAGGSLRDPEATLSILSTASTSDEALENVPLSPQPSSRRRSEHQEVHARPSPSAPPLLGHEGTAFSAGARDTGARVSPSAAEASVPVAGENASGNSSRAQGPSFGKSAASFVGPEDSKQNLLASQRNRVPSSLPETSMKPQRSQPTGATLASTPLTSPCPSSAELPPVTHSVASAYLPRGTDERQRHIFSTFASLVSSSPLTKTTDQASKGAFFSSRLVASGVSLSSLPDALKGDLNAGETGTEAPRPMGQQVAPSSLSGDREKANNTMAFSVASEAEASGAFTTGLGLWPAILPQVRVQSRFLRDEFAVHGEARRSRFRLPPRSSGRPRPVLPFLSRHKKVRWFFGAVLVTLALWLLWSPGKERAENCEKGRRVSVASEGRGEGRTEGMSDPQLFKRFFGNPKQMRFRAQEQGSFGEHQDRETVDDIMRWREYLRPAH
ncbi:UNVERIFIED_CONTAM: hypothetical protein HHA_204270 [Hammondia hammondi]|eukprot:XP_008887389.1 hypothetical protein HHA_204270 [Hammondia hammondi]